MPSVSRPGASLPPRRHATAARAVAARALPPLPGLPPGPLRQSLTLALLLHVLAVLVFGNTPGGSARKGEGVWGAIQVHLRGGAFDNGTGGTGPRDLVTPPDNNGPVGQARQQRHGGAVRPEASTAPPTTPGAARLGNWNASPAEQAVDAAGQDSPMPSRSAPPAPAPAVSAMPAMPDATEAPAPAPAPVLVPEAPTATRLSAETLDLPRAPVARAALAPAPVHLAVPAGPSAMDLPPLPAAVEAQPRILAMEPAPATLSRQPRAEPLALPAATQALARQDLPPPVPVPAPVLRERLQAPPADLPPVPALRADAVDLSPALTPAERRVQALPKFEPVTAPTPAAVPAPAPAATALAPPAAEAAAAAAQAMPASAAGEPAVSQSQSQSPPPSSRPAAAGSSVGPAPSLRPGQGAPDAGARLGHDVATPPSAAPDAPRLNLNLPSSVRGGALSSQGSVGVFQMLPRPPERKSKLEESIEKAAKEDCRKAHAGSGLLAVLPLALDAARKNGCKW